MRPEIFFTDVRKNDQKKDISLAIKIPTKKNTANANQENDKNFSFAEQKMNESSFFF